MPIPPGGSNGREALSFNANDRGGFRYGHRRLVTTYFITRHPGAVAWARQMNLSIDEVIDHLDPAILAPGDWVLGTLPVHLAAEVCQRGARYFHLSLNLPPHWRGRELSREDLVQFGATLEEFRISRVAGAMSAGG